MTENNINKHIETLIERYPSLVVCKESIQVAYDILKQAYTNGRKLLVCGNGGSAADSEHIVGELMKEFKLKREVYKNQADAMKQALSYATFIAALLRGKSGQEWWDFFMDREFVSKTIPDKIDIDVVTIMPQGETEEYCGEDIEVKELSTVLHCHSLYYNHDDFKEGYFNFSGTYISQLRK